MAFPLQLYRKLSSCTIRMTVNTRSMLWVMYVIQYHCIYHMHHCMWYTGYAMNYRKKSHVRCWHGTRNLDFLKKFPLSFAWDSPKTETGSDSFTLHQMASNPSHLSHWLQAWHSIETFTQIHTRIREHFHPIGTALANQYARKPQGLVLHCFQTRPNSSYRKIYCATGGQAAIYSGNKLKRKTRSRVSANLSVRHQNHTRLHDSGEPFCCGR